MFSALPQKRAFEEIISQIEQAIADGRLREGDRLPPERELAETFGVSRSSVREALRVLEVFGVVVARRGGGPDSGSVVANGSAAGLISALRLSSSLLGVPAADLVELRVVLEDHVARQAARENPPPTTLETLHRLADEMRGADRDHWHTLDTDFHLGIARLSGNVLIPLLMEALRELMSREMLRGLSRLSDWQGERELLIREHEAILDHIERHEADAAAGAIRGHIQRFYSQDIASQRDQDR
jgi:GntR family transcriptional repressor for pyruvate dehydrogenase complex